MKGMGYGLEKWVKTINGLSETKGYSLKREVPAAERQTDHGQ